MTDKSKYLATEIPGLVKDPKSSALLYTDTSKLRAYRRQKLKQANEALETQRINLLEQDVHEIKEMLRELLKR